MARYKDTRFWNNIEKACFNGVGPFDIPAIQPQEYVECKWIGFNYAMSCRNRVGKGVHFYLDDYQFERVWTDLDRYCNTLSDYDVVMSPDYSLYSNWPDALNIWNHYRKHFVAAYLQSGGVKVIPTICWNDEDSFEWCFDGEPMKSCVSISSVGSQMKESCRKGFMLGYDAMLERLQPETILFYGSIPKECRGNIVPIQAFQSRMDKISKEE